MATGRNYGIDRPLRRGYGASYRVLGVATSRVDYPREAGERSGGFAGVGPRTYRRSDDRIREDINEELTADPRLDASDIEVTVTDCEVTLSGEVERRADKRIAEELAESVPGVTEVNNKLKARRGLLEEMFGRHEDTFDSRDRDRDWHERERDRSTSVEPPSARLTPNVSLAGPAPANER
jgi:hypothetical protein